jgi:hypothetical protein
LGTRPAQALAACSGVPRDAMACFVEWMFGRWYWR